MKKKKGVILIFTLYFFVALSRFELEPKEPKSHVLPLHHRALTTLLRVLDSYK